MAESIEHRLRSSDPSGLDGDRLHTMCEQLCRLAGSDVGDVAAALGLPGPVVDENRDIAVLGSPPAFARRVVLARWKGAFTHLTIELAGTGLVLGELDRRFGAGVRRPMAHDGGAYVFSYDARVAGAPWACAVFASIGNTGEPPHAGSVITEVTARRDRAR